jgi:hypothetical protein
MDGWEDAWMDGWWTELTKILDVGISENVL